MIFKHFINRNPKFAKSGNFRDLTVSSPKVQGPNCNFTPRRRKTDGFAGEHDSDLLTLPQAPDHLYKLPGIQSCNQNNLTIPELAGIWP